MRERSAEVGTGGGAQRISGAYVEVDATCFALMVGAWQVESRVEERRRGEEARTIPVSSHRCTKAAETKEEAGAPS